MPRYATTIQSPLSVDEVWARVADVTRFVEWDPGVLGAEQVSGDGPGPNAAYELTVRGVRGPLDMRYDVNEFAPPSRLFLVADTGALRSEDEITIEPDGEGSELIYRAELRFGGFYAIANPVMSIAFKFIGWRAARGLRRFLEGA
ncbi:MAG: SRPBCC family protein [Acidimicrobiia bacterium]|nr:SRPBCC family protein [Acidimicrobiia bacterium]